MKIIQRDRIVLRQPDTSVIDETFRQLRDIYQTAYDWEPTAITATERLSSSPMRHFVKSWITEWDLNRFHPDIAVDITTEDIVSDYSEDRNLEHSSDDGNSTDDDSDNRY